MLFTFLVCLICSISAYGGTVDESLYFGGYDAWSNLEMLQDVHRMRSFEEAVHRGRQHFSGSVVIDLGCGSGILSLYAARAGAKRVYCIDANEFASRTVSTIIHANGYDDVISLVQGNVLDPAFTLPEKANVLLSEWMGYFLWAEDMFRAVQHMRDNWLLPKGIIWPSEGVIYMQPMMQTTLKSYMRSFWSNVSGFDLSVVHAQLGGEMQMFRGQVQKEHVIGTPQVLGRYDFSTIQYGSLAAKAPFSFSWEGKKDIIGLVFWFDVRIGDVVLSTAPGSYTHWGQTMVYFRDLWGAEGLSELTGVVAMERFFSDQAGAETRDIVADAEQGSKKSAQASLWLNTSYSLGEVQLHAPVRVELGPIHDIDQDAAYIWACHSDRRQASGISDIILADRMRSKHEEL